MAWQTFAKLNGKYYLDYPVVLKNIRFSRMTLLQRNGSITFKVNIFKSGAFEISESGSQVVTGQISSPEEFQKEFISLPYPEKPQSSYLRLNREDFYKILRLRGYNYKNLFCGFLEGDNAGSDVYLEWKNNWTTFIDTMLQSCVLNVDTKGFFVQIGIEKIVIDPKLHLSVVQNTKVSLKFNDFLKSIRAGGVEIKNLNVHQITPLVKEPDPLLEKYVFVPYIQNKNFQEFDLPQLLYVSIQIVRENTAALIDIDSLEVVPENERSVYEELMTTNLEGKLIASKFKTIKYKELDTLNSKYYDLVFVKNLLRFDPSKILRIGKFVFTETTDDTIDPSYLDTWGLSVALQYRIDSKYYWLLNKRNKETENSVVIHVSNNNSSSWIEELKEAMKNLDQGTQIYLVTHETKSGLIGFFNCIRLELENVVLKIFLLENQCSFQTQAGKNLAINVCKNGIWGSYKYLPMDPPKNKETMEAILVPKSIGSLSTLTWMEKNPYLRYLTLKNFHCF